ncbi:uncharacterized protein K02A2.6-like [Pararge aegeria]|uniref:uncharacterized protein K02A2.6-like n=1 Tax=Pararge aegeria TaxID=116150 RepID=UPI0019D0FDD5|nr:uncharacterized protein K02A2.6-like [Pararge aegeria]
MPIGKIEPFDLTSKQWPAYIRRVKQFIVLNEIRDELQVPMLITVVGEATYALMCDLCAPDHPENKSFDTLTELVTNHLEPQRSEIAERHVFRQRRQRPDESLTEYLQHLKHLAVTCNFGTRLEEDLRDQFVSGLASDVMRSRIFAEKSLDYKKAVELALALEAAERHAGVSGGEMSASGGQAGEGLHAACSQRTRALRPGGGDAGAACDGAGASGGGGGGAASAAAAACWRCGRRHRGRCRFANYTCDECHQRGHIKVMCKSVRKSEVKCQSFISESSDEDFFNIDIITQGNKPYYLKVKVEDSFLEVEIDTGSRISAINEECYEKLFKHKEIVKDNLILRSYSGSRIDSLGYILVRVQLKSVISKDLRLYIIQGGNRPLLGRDWLRALKITQININEIIEEDQFVTRLSKEFPEVFSEKRGTCNRKLQLQLTDSTGVYVRARAVPLALRERVERELARLESDGTIYRVDHSDFGTPIVPVVKSNGDIRICGDYKITINPKLKRDYYPLPRIDELFTNLSNGEEYSKIDLRHAYEQVLLEESSQKYTAITTHIGTFIYRRTPYGLSCVPEKFQKLMEETLRGVPGTVVFLDDICVTGQNRQAHLNNLRAVLERLRQAGLTVKLNKCKFLQKNVNYLGFVIDKEGLHPDSEKLKAIHEIPTPKDVTQLKSFLGLINYYGRFIPNLSTILYPLHALLKRKNQWNWDLHCDTAFKSAKKALLGKRVLAHYEEGRPLVLSVDSSAYGIGAVLAHRYEDGQERPVSCASRTLNEAEKKYSQLDKEALAIYFGITKHHQFLFGRHFVLKTDHKPLTFIFGNNNGIPQTAASRLQRWAVRLAGYDFSIEFVRSKNNGPADALSRLPILHEQSRTHPAQQVTYTNLLEEMLPVNFKQIANESQKDSVLCKIIKYVMFGWPASVVSNEEKAYFIRKSEICVDLGCLMYKYRVIIPSGLRKTVLRELHEGHLGMNKMKNISRNYVYWPNIDNDIEELCRSCPACRHVRDAPARAPLHPWEFPQHPWQRLHADFADCGGKRYLIIVDAHSKWIEVVEMLKTTASVTINSLRSVFARFGLPCQLVTDNGPPFLSEEFKTYCLKNCIKHTTSAPYRPQGNGEAENAVKTVKKIIKRAKYEREDISVALNRFLFQYRNCDHATTKVSPAVALLGHRLRSRLDALRPDVTSTVREEQDKQRARSTGCNRAFGIGEAVLARDYTKRTGKWSEGLISEQTGPVSYKVKVGNGTEWRRHQDQLAPLKNNNNRYSLSRASQPEGENSTSGANVESDTETPSVGQPSQIKEAKEHSDHEDAQEASVSVESVPFPLPVGNPPVPGASARALRAYKRYNNLSNN